MPTTPDLQPFDHATIPRNAIIVRWLVAGWIIFLGSQDPSLQGALGAAVCVSIWWRISCLVEFSGLLGRANYKVRLRIGTGTDRR